MIDLHYWPTPNGWKLSIMLEECVLPYRMVPVNIGKGEQFRPEFLAISPNNRMPAIVDHDPPGGGEPVAVFESGACLLYLAEKTGRFLPADLLGEEARLAPQVGEGAADRAVEALALLRRQQRQDFLIARDQRRQELPRRELPRQAPGLQGRSDLVDGGEYVIF